MRSFFVLFVLTMMIISLVDSNVPSLICQMFLSDITLMTRRHQSIDGKLKFFTSFCALKSGLTPAICFKTAMAFKDTVLDILVNHNVQPYRFCKALNGHYPSWTVDTTDLTAEPYTPMKNSHTTDSISKILHLTDTHMDPDYKVDSITNCGEPICCHVVATSHGKNQKYAGIYGDRACDTPYIVLDSLLEDATKRDNYDFIFFTGDVVPHNDWSQSKPYQIKCLTNTVNIFKKYLTNMTLVVSIGNHESFPVDNFNSIDNTKSSWLYESFANLLKPWLDDQAFQTARKYGFYTMLFKNKVRVISMNTNFCEKMNFWLIVKNNDPFNQLKWMKNLLKQASANKEKVYIIGHHPPNSPDCLEHWGAAYNKIVAFFPTTIVGQFFGHEHNDYFNIQFNEHLNAPTNPQIVKVPKQVSIQDQLKPWQIRYAAPSVTTFGMVNPAYRVYLTDNDPSNNEYKRITDFNTFTFDLDEANKGKHANWRLLYKATEFFKVPNVDAGNMMEAVMSMRTNFTFYRDYKRLQDRLPNKLVKCNYREWFDTLCELLRPTANDAICSQLIDMKKMKC